MLHTCGSAIPFFRPLPSSPTPLPPSSSSPESSWSLLGGRDGNTFVILKVFVILRALVPAAGVVVAAEPAVAPAGRTGVTTVALAGTPLLPFSPPIMAVLTSASQAASLWLLLAMATVARRRKSRPLL